MIVGIDLGTTNSCICYYTGTEFTVIQNELGYYTTLSCISFHKKSQEIVYGTVLSNKESYTIISNFKRLVGIKYNDFCNNTELKEFFRLKDMNIVNSLENEYCAFRITHNDITYNIDIKDVIIKYIMYLIGIAKTNIEFENVVITVPVYFTDIQRSILKNCFESIDNIKVIRIINEPTAAALAYSKEIREITEFEKLLIVDSGGGTTDFSILEMDYNSQIYRVIDVFGDNYLGGEDITNCIVDYIQKIINIKYNKNIIKEANLVKESLSFRENTQFILDEYNFCHKISRNKFEYICKDFFDKFNNILQEFLKNHMIDITKIVFVGGTTRIPKIYNILHDILPNAIINNTINPDYTVSVGAAFQGYLLDKMVELDQDNDILLMDVISMSLGVESDSGLMNVILSKNTTIPVTNTMYFTNDKDYMSEIDINIYQGERKLIKNNTLLYTLKLTGLNDDLLQEQMNIKIDFTVDSDGILSVIAYEKNSNSITKITLDKINESNINNNVDIDDIFNDTYIANQIILKNKLYKKFKELLVIFQERNYANDTFECKLLNLLFNKTFETLSKYTEYSPDQLQNILIDFENEFHNINIVDKLDT